MRHPRPRSRGRRPPRLARSEPVDWFRSQTQRLVQALHDADDGEPVWTWWEQSQHVGFVRRRQLIEVAVRGWDAANAVGSVASIPAPVAAVGITEFAEVMSHDRLDGADPLPVRVVAIDADVDVMLFASPAMEADDVDRRQGARRAASGSGVVVPQWRPTTLIVGKSL